MKCLDGCNNVKVYNLTALKNLPDWLSERKKKRKPKKKDEDLLQDFEMPDVSNCIRLSADGQYLMATGTYKPVMKCYDLNDLAVKFERGMDAEVLRFAILSEDYSKIAFLQEGRVLELHGQGGRVHRLRVPRCGRDLVLHTPSADLYIAAAGNEIYRLNLFQGRFLNSLTTQSSSVNRITLNRRHGLLTGGTDDGLLHCWDPRTRSHAATMDVGLHMVEHAANSLDQGLQRRRQLRITALENNDAFALAVGNQTGQVLMYDIRCNKPYLIRDHQSRTPVHSIHFHSSGNMFSMAPTAVKIWNKDTGAVVTSIEGDSPFNDMAVAPDTGIIFLAAEDRRMKAYFIPSLGPAPQWCSHLDAMTEEMEERGQDGAVTEQYDDYTFVSAHDLIKLGLRDLIGTSMLRAVMHGYYISTPAYNKAKRLANPVLPATVAAGKVKEAIKKENTHHLKMDKVTATVNAELSARVAALKDEEVSKQVLDPRFAQIFSNTKFSRDPTLEKFLDKSRIMDRKIKSSFKKRQAEIKKEEEEFRRELAQDVDAGACSDGGDGAGDGDGDGDSETDSIMQEFAVEKRETEPADEQRVKQMQQLFRKRR